MPENAIYVQQENEQGETVYVEVTETTELELPESLVTGSTHYQTLKKEQGKTVRESRKRLKRAQNAEALLGETDEDDVAPSDEGDSDNPPATPQPTASIEDITKAVLKQVYETQAETARVRNEKETEVDNLITEHKLGKIDGIKEAMLSGDMKEVAAIVGRQKYQFDDSVGGETSVMSNMDDFLAKVDAKVGFIKE